jgi:small-conductance mechanosensitive channel
MKQPDTAALRERLANYTPEEELKQDLQELDGLLQEVNCQMVELRNLLKEIRALKEELHDIHGSLKHTVQRERTAFKALEAAKESADNIVDGISNAIAKTERNTVIHAKVDVSELARVNQCSANHIKAEKKLLEEHSKELAKHLQKNEGIWLSSGWLRFTIVILTICCIAVVLWACLKN